MTAKFFFFFNHYLYLCLKLCISLSNFERFCVVPSPGNELDGISAIMYNGNIVNPFSDKFANGYSLKYIGRNARPSILSETKNYFDTRF